MARNCNCAGASCGCKVIEGTGIDVTGTGTAADPYVIVNTGASLGTALLVQDTSTLDLTKTGSGTNIDPTIISGNVTLKLQQLIDVNDPQGAPLAGEVPIYVGTSGAGGHWEFRPPSTAAVAAPAWEVNYLQAFLEEQLHGTQRPLLPGKLKLDRLYPIPYTGGVGVSWEMPTNTRPTDVGTYIQIGSPGDILPDFRGLAYGAVVGPFPDYTLYRVQGGKITDNFYPMGPPATPDAGGFFAVDLTTVGVHEKGPWAFRLELATAPGVAVGGLWPATSSVYTNLNLELHAISDDDYLVKSTPAPTSGHWDFVASTPGVKRAVLRDTATGTLFMDSEPITGNIRSYVVFPGQPGYGTRFPEQCYVYDQAVALCAAISVGDDELADQLMSGIVRLQTHGGAQNGGFRFSGRQGSAEYGDPAYRTGAHALALFAVLAYMQMYPQQLEAYRQVALDAITWMNTQKAPAGSNREGLYLGGVGNYVPDGGGGQAIDENYSLTWASTEHNIDAYFALKLAGLVLGGTYTTDATALGTVMWSKLWNASLSRLNQGLGTAGPDTADPLDVHSWGSIFLLASGHSSEAVTTMSDSQLAPFKTTRAAPNGKTVTGYATAYNSAGYPSMIPHVWWEGTFSVAYAMRKLEQVDRWYATMRDATPGQFADGSYPYVSDYDATYELVPYKSVASTAWGMLSLVGTGIFDTGAVLS